MIGYRGEAVREHQAGLDRTYGVNLHLVKLHLVEIDTTEDLEKALEIACLY